MGALNTKNAEAHRLAREIAEATGESLTGAVILALREKKAALDAAMGPDPKAVESLLAFGRKYGPMARAAGERADWDGDLYDEIGLPR